MAYFIIGFIIAAIAASVYFAKPITKAEVDLKAKLDAAVKAEEAKVQADAASLVDTVKSKL
jgi:hypothetical protein